MKNKKHIRQLVSVKFTDRKTPIDGYVVNYNDDWTLMKYNPDDYIKRRAAGNRRLAKKRADVQT